MSSRRRRIGFLLSLLPCLATTSPCTLCADPNSTISLSEKEISVPGFDFIGECGQLDSLVRVFLSDDDPLCWTLRNVSSGCGCPKCEEGCGEQQRRADNHDRRACSLCPNGDNITLPDRLLDLDGFPVQTCGELDMATHLFLEEGDSMCSLMQSVSTFCGCPAPIENSCSLCRDGGPVPLPNATFGFLEPEFGFRPTCALVEAQLDTIPAGSDQCLQMQSFGSLCDCPPLENACQACPNPPESFSHEILPVSRDILGMGLSCYEISRLTLQTEQRSDLCFALTDRGWLCGCNGGNYVYFNADTLTKKILLVWVPRAAAFLSMMGSLFICWDILRSKKKLKNTFHQIMLAMSCFDICSSLAWAFTSVPIPQYSPYGFPTGIYGARGNDQTCTAQGFFIFIQLGLTGALYNLSLSCYYTLAIALGWTEAKLRRVRFLLHLPAVIGLALALAAIPYYDSAAWGCHLRGPPIDEAFHVSVFIMLPITCVLVIGTINMAIVTLAVRRNLRRSSKWRRGGNKSQDLETQVLWQAVFYLSAFYVSYPLLIVSNIRPLILSSPYWFYLATITLAPLQGFNNFLVYVRPRVMRRVHQNRAERKRNLRMSQQTRGSSTCPALSDESFPARQSALYSFFFGRFLARTHEPIGEGDDLELHLASEAPEKTDSREVDLELDEVQEFDDEDVLHCSVGKEDVISIASHPDDS